MGDNRCERQWAFMLRLGLGPGSTDSGAMVQNSPALAGWARGNVSAPMIQRAPFTFFAVLALTLLNGCSANETSGTPAGKSGGAGSSLQSGGAANSGGKSGNTGGTGTGGGVASGGRMNTGGAPAFGGASATGGVAAVNYNPCPPAGTPCVVLPFGDSITWGFIHPEVGGYRAPLYELAHKAGKSLTFVGSKSDGPDMVDGVAFPKAHEGVGGETLEQMLARFSGSFDYPSLNANIVLLHAGTNNTSAEPPQTAEARLALLEALLDKLIMVYPEALVVVAKNIPFRDLATSQTLVEPYNNLMPALVQAKVAAGKHVILIDQYTPFIQDVNFPTTLMEDEDHPNNTGGYPLMAATWYQAIGPLLH